MFESLSSQEFWMALAGAGALVLQITLTLGVTLRVILTRHPPGSSFAWILLTIALPFVGFFLALSDKVNAGRGLRLALCAIFLAAFAASLLAASPASGGG